MTHIRRWLSVILITALAFSLLAVPIQAAQPKLTLSAPKTLPRKDETFTVTLSLSGNPGINCVQFTLHYDTAFMVCTDVEAGALVSGMIGAKNNRTSTGDVLMAYASSSEIAKDGVVATFTFQALKDFEKYSFSLESVELAESSGTKYAVEIVLPTGEKKVDPETPDEPVKPDDPVTPDDPVNPDDPVTPDDPVKPDDPTVVSFKDVAADYWGAPYIAEAVERGYFKGYADGTFRPDQSITRAQFVTVLWRCAGCPEPSKASGFTDISNLSAEFQKAIAWGAEEGYVNGTGKTVFNPGGGLTREAAMCILYRYSGGASGMEMMFYSSYDAYFTDSSKISNWAKPAMYWAYYNKVITGTGTATLSPQKVTTRAQLAKILVEYMDHFN